MPEMFYAENDRKGRDIELMWPNNRSLDAQSLDDLEDASA
jgi:hypothetical protein